MTYDQKGNFFGTPRGEFTGNILYYYVTYIFTKGPLIRWSPLNQKIFILLACGSRRLGQGAGHGLPVLSAAATVHIRQAEPLQEARRAGHVAELQHVQVRGDRVFINARTNT